MSINISIFYIFILNIAFVLTGYCICPHWILYLSEIKDVFVLNLHCICPKLILHFSQLDFVVVTCYCICLYCVLYLFQLNKVFVQTICCIFTWLGSPFVWFINGIFFTGLYYPCKGVHYRRATCLVYIKCVAKISWF